MLLSRFCCQGQITQEGRVVVLSAVAGLGLLSNSPRAFQRSRLHLLCPPSLCCAAAHPAGLSGGHRGVHVRDGSQVGGAACHLAQHPRWALNLASRRRGKCCCCNRRKKQAHDCVQDRPTAMPRMLVARQTDTFVPLGPFVLHAVRAPMLFSLSSFALSLLLGFRTNQSIAR